MEKHQQHDQKTHGSWANSWATGARETPDGKWLIDNFGDKTTFTRNDPNGLLRFSIPNSLIDDPRYQETIQLSLDTLEKLQASYPLTTQVDFVKGDKLEGGFLGETFSASVDGVPAPSKIILAEGLLKPNAEKDSLVHTIVHEWGHAQDFRTADVSRQHADKLVAAGVWNGDIPMTDYGFTNDREAYAEAFAIKFNGAHKGGAWSANVPQTDKWEEVFKIFELDTLNKAKGERVSFKVWDTFDANNPPKLIEDYDSTMEKHGTHDQKTHGSWATGASAWGIEKKANETTFRKEKHTDDRSGFVEVTVPNKFLSDPALKADIDNALNTIEKLHDSFPIKTRVTFSEDELGRQNFIAETSSTNLVYGVVTVHDISEINVSKRFFGEDSESQAHILTHEWGHATDSRSVDIARQQADKFSHAKFEDDSIPMTNYGYASDREVYAEAFAIKFNNSHKGGIYSSQVEQTDKWEEVFKIFELDTVNKAVGKRISFKVWDTFDVNNPPKLIEDYDPTMQKHGTHDQKTHGNWATGGTIYTSIIDRLSQKDVTGFSLDISSRNAPKSGYMTSDDGAEEKVSYDDFFSSRDRSREILLEYIEKNAEALSDKGAYFGIWVVKDQGTVYLDVSRRYDTRGDAVRAGFANGQESVYDIENDEYIYMKDEEDDRTNKSVDDGSTNPRQSNDPRAEASLRGGDSQRNREESPHICLGRHQGVEKHLEGQHDQATHGSWASGRFGEDSVKSARDGAKEYAFKAGIKQDDSIDYQKTVANRARAARIADAYDELPTVQEEAFPAYTALATEVEAQYEYMTKTMGIKVEFVDTDPYKTSREMFADVSKGTLKVLRTASTGSHPFFTDEQNDKFRAVHDFFGHAATGRGFGQDGEESAWVHHSQMFTETARGALTTETRGQNSWYNSRGKVFAEQKVALLPKEFWEVPDTFEKRYRVIKFEAGLIPILKHQEHDQSTHGNWATAGYTEEEKARIAEWENLGPALEDLDALWSPVTDDELKEMLLNDENVYPIVEQAIANYVQAEIDDFASRVERSPTPAEIEGITERVTEERIQATLETYRDEYREKIRESKGQSVEALTPYLEEVFNMEHTYTDKSGVERTIRSEVTDVGKTSGDDADPHEIYVNGVVLDENGDEIGKFERYFFKDETTGVWAVEHKWLEMAVGYRGVGFGKTFIQKTEDFFTHRGIGYIKVLAGLEDGARHWANAGYDFEPDDINDSAFKIRERFQNVIAQAPPDFFEQADIDEFNSMYDRMVDTKTDTVRDMKNPDFPFPAEFAMIGYDRRKDWKGTPTWLGKASFYGMAINYVKPLTAEGRNLLSGPIDRDGDGLIYDGTGRERPAPAPANN
jgi:hypothetical protein